MFKGPVEKQAKKWVFLAKKKKAKRSGVGAMLRVLGAAYQGLAVHSKMGQGQFMGYHPQFVNT